MSRILDISMERTLLGMMLGYGHFIFETAAQDQGLREIRYVGRPEERDKTIQRIIQRAGLRQRVQVTPPRTTGRSVPASRGACSHSGTTTSRLAHLAVQGIADGGQRREPDRGRGRS
ncbi:MAG: hypothetical protein R2722_04445 [Tessaracoccus sp.]